ELGFWAGLWAKVFKTEAPQPKFGVIDSGADVSHPLLKRVKEVKNMTSGANVDDIGHGSWVHSTVLHMAPWSRNTTHYKTFLNGSATLDDILKSLTQAGNDGNLVISNSWGDDEGDRNGPDAQLVKKLASEGHIMVFAAGNAGSGKNTIGSPAIVTYKDPTTGAIRVVSVAAAGRDKKIAYFSSRGPGSPKTAKDPSYKDHRPDLTAVGYNIEGAWPAALNEADRVDGEKGPVKAISGTSMSTPGVAGALALLAMMFGVTEKGEKLDAIVNAEMATLEKTGQGADNEGEGFLNVDAAYKKLQAQFSTIAPDVTRFRALNKRLTELDRFIGMTGSWKYGVMIDGVEFARAIQERKSVAVTLTAMQKADNTLAYRAAGPIKRLILNATGAAPKP
ncbi:MAG: S8 family serine peptidase, partial [Elusimicrobiota bacterium]